MKISVALLTLLAIFAVFHGVKTHIDDGKERYQWALELESGTEVWQSAVAIDDGPRAYISSKVYWINKDKLSSSQLIQDFSTDPAVTVVKIHGVCYLLEGDNSTNFNNETYADIVGTFEDLGGIDNIIPTFTEVLMTATAEGALLNETERHDLYDTNRKIFKICHPYFTPIYRAVIGNETTTAPQQCEQRIQTPLFRNETLKLTIPVKYGVGCGGKGSYRHRHYW